MNPEFKAVLLAYPDNPVGRVFFQAFQKEGAPLYAVVVERFEGETNRGRFLEKIRKDGLAETLRRVAEMVWMKVTRTTIVHLARENGVPVHFVEQFNGPDCVALLRSLSPDLLCIASAPILKSEVFETARIGCLNAHPGWLPQYRGIGANAHALSNGDEPAVSLHFIDATIDQGSLLHRERVPIRHRDTVARINDRAVARGAVLMAQAVARLAADEPLSPIHVTEPLGPVYRALSYDKVKPINRRIRRHGGFMRHNRVLLISPPSSSYLGAARPPQNLGFLAQALVDHGIEYDVLDMRLGHEWKSLKKKIDAFRPDLVGVTLVSLEYLKSYDLIRQIKSHIPDVKVIVGGPHVTVCKKQVLEECEAIDFGVVNEGEATLVEICQGQKAIPEIAGLIHRQEGEVVYNGPRSEEANLDNISWPRYEKFEMKRYIQEMAFNSSRGCPYQCVFCPNKIMTRKWRFRSPADVVDEVEYWYHKGYRIFNFDDDNFTLDNDRVYAICDEIERRGINDAEFRCSNGIRADRTNRPLLKRMREVGFNYIAFGVDGGNNRMLKINKKGETIEQIEQGIKDATELGFDVKIFVILAMPQETLADVEDALALVRRYPIKRVLLNNPIPYPGTELYETVRDNGWFITQPEVYLNQVAENGNTPVFATPEISFEERVALIKRIRAVEKEVTRAAVKRMYAHLGPMANLLAAVAATSFMENLFFKFKPFRRLVEWVRYRQLLAKQRQRRAEAAA